MNNVGEFMNVVFWFQPWLNLVWIPTFWQLHRRRQVKLSKPENSTFENNNINILTVVEIRKELQKIWNVEAVRGTEPRKPLSTEKK